MFPTRPTFISTVDDDLSERMLLRREYLDLTDKSEQDTTLDDIEKTLKKADELASKVKTPNEAVLDSILFRQCTERTNHIIAQYGKISSFNHREFIEKLTLHNSNIVTENPQFDEEQWKRVHDLFTQTNKVCYAICPPLDILYGTFNMDEIQIVNRAPRQALVRDAEDEIERRPQELTLESTKDDTETTPQEVDQIFLSFKQCIKENHNNPISYMRFVANPNCFATTVQNMFHFSFLFKENKVKFANDEKTFIDIQDVQLNPNQAMEKCTTAITITVQEWLDFIRDNNITEPMIKPTTG